MEKDIKKVIEEIEVPMEKLDDVIYKGIKLSNVKPKKQRYSTLFGSVAIIGLILCSGFVSPKMGSVLANVPVIGFMYEIEEHDVGLHVAMMDENKVLLNQVLESNGVAITIEDIVYDGTRIAFTYTHDIVGYDEIYPLTIKVNGEEINFSESLHGLEAETGFRGLIEIIPVAALPDTFQLEISIHQIGHTNGDWSFSTELTKVNNNTRELKVGQEGKIDGLTYTINNAEVSNTGTLIEVAFESSKLDEIYSAERIVRANFTDQNGMPLQIVESNGNDNIFKYILAPLSDEVTEIHVLHYSIPTRIERVEINEELKEQFPQTISQGDMGDIVITDVKKVDNEYVMTFHSTSKFVFDAGFFPNLIDILDESGNQLITDYPKVIGPNEYELKFNATRSKVFIHTIELPKMEIEKSAKVIIPLK
jgi:hypothetical protein